MRPIFIVVAMVLVAGVLATEVLEPTLLDQAKETAVHWIWRAVAAVMRGTDMLDITKVVSATAA